ncbi:MAG: DMT family transporter, partial [Desulfobacterales bacterium]|nr:DMT family transporter [Desulfobacterales bacterium]
CIIGAAVIGYTPPETGDSVSGNLFSLGIAFAFIATLGWGTEGVLVTSGMDFIEPDAALNIRYLVSSCFFIGFILISPLILDLPEDISLSRIIIMLAKSKGTLVMAATGTIGGMTFVAWYRAMNMTGVSRAMALNISYALWAVIFGALFTDLNLTTGLVTGAICIFLGSLFVIGNPKDMMTLRQID